MTDNYLIQPFGHWLIASHAAFLNRGIGALANIDTVIR